MSQKIATKITAFFPPANLLPLLFAYLFDHVAVSTHWIFFSIWLNEDIIGANPGLQYPFLLLAVILATPSFLALFWNTLITSFSDKTGRRKEFMFFSKLLLTAQCLLLIFYGNSIVNVLLIYGAFGIHTVFYTLHSALITSICHPDRRGEVVSFQLIFASGGWMIGSGISGTIYNAFGMTGNLAFSAGFAIVAGILPLFSQSKPWFERKDIISQMREEMSPPEESKGSKEQQQTLENREKDNLPAVDSPKDSFIPIGDSYRIPELLTEVEQPKSKYWNIFSRRNIIILLVTLAIVDFGFGPFNVMASVYLKATGVPNNFIAISNTIATFIGMSLQLFIGKFSDRRGRRPLFLIGIFAYPILYGLTYLLSGYWVAVFLLYCYPLYALKVPSANAIMSDLTAENERARGMNLIQFEQTLSLNLGALLGCFLADVLPKGIMILPLMPTIFGVIAVILAFFIFQETHEKIVNRNKKS
ncbi:MAG: MFS transporter [Candidatus Heimdallarchaeota archaeon]|nr:MFS transporter [Candidatus Heimdallarchaeota archaeon]